MPTMTTTNINWRSVPSTPLTLPTTLRVDVLGEAEVGQQTVLVVTLQVVRMDLALHAVVRNGMLRIAELDHRRRVELLFPGRGGDGVLYTSDAADDLTRGQRCSGTLVSNKKL